MSNEETQVAQDYPDNSFVVVIGRQFGSGGRMIGRKIAEALGVPYYDKSLLKEAAAEFGLSDHLFNAADEKRPSLLRSLLHLNYGATSAPHDTTSLSNEGLYTAQSKVIRKLASRGSCVIVGRTADHILKDHPKLISIFLHAPLEERARRAAGRGDAEAFEKAKSLALHTDKKRESYYNYFTGRRWGFADNYTFSLDSSRISQSAIIELVKDALGKQK